MEKNIVTQFITPVEDPTIPNDKVVCRDCGVQVPATFIEMSTHQQHEGTYPLNTVAGFKQKQ